MVENIIVIPKRLWKEEGFVKAYPGIVYELVVSGLCKQRDSVENDPSFLQIIPYVVLHKERNIVVYKRAGSEARLFDKWSIGFGGHMLCSETVTETIERELQEELFLPLDTSRLHYQGVIYYPVTDVSKVHLGVVYSYEISQLPQRHSDEVKELKWYENETLEEWSALIMEHIKKGEVWRWIG